MQDSKLKGLVVEILPNAEYKIQLSDGRFVRGYLSGKMRINKVKVDINDVVEIILPSQGEICRIIYRV